MPDIEELLMDVKGGESNCCGASMYLDICGSCKEHATDVEQDREELAKDDYFDR